jgi:hypothetical protein
VIASLFNDLKTLLVSNATYNEVGSPERLCGDTSLLEHLHMLTWIVSLGWHGNDKQTLEKYGYTCNSGPIEVNVLINL